MQTENQYIETDLGNICPNPRGEYDPAAQYEFLDFVTYLDGSYICTTENGKKISGIAPAQNETTETWQLASRAGTATDEYKQMHNEVVLKAEEAKEVERSITEKEQSVETLKESAENAEQRAEEQARLAENSKDSAAGYATTAGRAASSAAGSAENAAQHLVDVETADTLIKKDIEIGTTLTGTLTNTVTAGCI